MPSAQRVSSTLASSSAAPPAAPASAPPPGARHSSETSARGCGRGGGLRRGGAVAARPVRVGVVGRVRAPHLCEPVALARGGQQRSPGRAPRRQQCGRLGEGAAPRDGPAGRWVVGLAPQGQLASGAHPHRTRGASCAGPRQRHDQSRLWQPSVPLPVPVAAARGGAARGAGGRCARPVVHDNGRAGARGQTLGLRAPPDAAHLVGLRPEHLQHLARLAERDEDAGAAADGKQHNLLGRQRRHLLPRLVGPRQARRPALGPCRRTGRHASLRGAASLRHLFGPRCPRR
eukprot:scaffold4526_cov89-Isochrysis_galbana.AAC.2